MQAKPAWGPSTPEDELVVAFGRVIRAFKHGQPEGVDPAAVAVLHHVACHAPVRLTTVAEGLGLDLSTVSRHVRSLEQAGHLRRDSDPDDRRAARLSPTETGLGMLAETMTRRAARLRDVIAGWPADDRAALVRLLGRLAEDLEDRQ